MKAIIDGFRDTMEQKMSLMWAKKLGLSTFNTPIFNELIKLMIDTTVDYTIFFRELSNVPEDIEPLTKSFYPTPKDEDRLKRWTEWLQKWRTFVQTNNPKSINASSKESQEALSRMMKKVNPKYTLREWHLVPAYQRANDGDYTLLNELHEVMTEPYAEQSPDIEKKYYQKKPTGLFNKAGVSHVSCSS
jgi:uncharacterized protein YdiU (UPF0061 family)